MYVLKKKLLEFHKISFEKLSFYVPNMQIKWNLKADLEILLFIWVKLNKSFCLCKSRSIVCLFHALITALLHAQSTAFLNVMLIWQSWNALLT